MNTVQPADFLKQLKAHDKNKYSIVTTLRDLILKGKPTVEEIKYGGLLYSHKEPYTGIFVYTNHVTLEFSEGAKLNDPQGLLRGSGKHRRNIKFLSIDDIDAREIEALLKQAKKQRLQNPHTTLL